SFSDLDETARFSSDDDWMPRVVLIAKNVLVWLDQLSKSYARPIHTLDAVPDEELTMLSSRGFNALWLIGLWERSNASREIKQRMGNPEAAASAYSLYGYDIAGELGGWAALENLRERAASRGIRLSSDMVPNHVGLDSDWVRNHPDWLLSTGECPYPGYSFNSDNLSHDGNVDIRLEDHYWNRSDAAVVFQRTNRQNGETMYVYHGNDGTTMPWNDTAQIDFLNPQAREAVIQDIIHVARNFPIIRFDAAMVLARKHIRRLWFPAPGAGGAIPSRSEHALSDEEFMEACPVEFWRDVVDRLASEVPGTLLLAEAFWMMEGYFVRVLGMHRVYNSAFMNMLRDQKNSDYRDMIKETLAFDPGILQRFVNFMNNPDEETAIDQFGNDDRYFAACTLLATLPGLPMFGHGQIEGLSEKYGMEYVRAYKEEQPDSDLISRHEREIFPLLERRAIFAGAPSFRLFDLHGDEGVNENVFAYSNSSVAGQALVIVNNSFERASGTIHHSASVKISDTETLNQNLDEALGLNPGSEEEWLLMRDTVNGLWYLRSTSEIKDRGLMVVIDGFGRQVFMDFRQERETPEGLWGKLAAELAGAG
ncbi:MAG: alpha-amylase, partial [Spirochaetaceae bacterium]|nr:alpha-amylase [Spirochaetaceae bacterium]